MQRPPTCVPGDWTHRHGSTDFLDSTPSRSASTGLLAAIHAARSPATRHDGARRLSGNRLPRSGDQPVADPHCAHVCDDCHESTDPLVSVRSPSVTPRARLPPDTARPAAARHDGARRLPGNPAATQRRPTCCRSTPRSRATTATSRGTRSCRVRSPRATPRARRAIPRLTARRCTTREPPASCQAVGCHPGTNLLPIHTALACADCHSSSDTTVTDAIAAGDKRCATCHPDADHTALHVTAEPPASCQAAGCHPGTNLLPIHTALACADCHSSSDTTVTDAIAAGDKRCDVPSGGRPHALHVTAEPPASCQAAGCHPGTNLLPIHTALACADCHSIV